jgi:hypothetical protein
MTTKEPTSERNLDGYDAPLIPWAKVRERLDQGWTQAPGTGGPDRHMYEVAPKTVFALGAAEPFGATRFRF